MITKSQPFIEELTWDDVRKDVAESCIELSNIIDEIAPDKKYPVFKVRYPFGAKILDNVVFHLPDNHGYSLPITDSRIPQNICDKLSYSPVPLCITVKNKVEIFREIEDKVFSLAFYGGDMDTGIWEHFGWTTPYSITAGARSLYMLPRISELSCQKRLRRKYGISSTPPKKLFDHWKVFTQIANSSNFKEEWCYETIILTDKWVDKIGNDPAWYKLERYLWRKAWQHCGYARKKSMLDVIWEIFARSINARNLRVNPYVIDTLKHLIFIGTGTVPASAPAINDEAGPIKELQLIYEDCYGLKDYVPTIMQPCYISATSTRPVYYSLQAPTLLESIPKSKKLSHVIDYIRELEELLTHVGNDLPWPKFELEKDSPSARVMDKLNFDFFHGEMFAYGPSIRSSKEMLEFDQTLTYTTTGNKSRIFADNSPFLRGCVRISLKK